jgi:hypothetical protein
LLSKPDRERRNAFKSTRAISIGGSFRVEWEEVTGMGEAEQAGRYFYSTVKLNELGITHPSRFLSHGIL